MRRRINYANVTATLALFFAMSGGALAAKHYLINSTKQINPKVLKALKGNSGPGGAAGLTGKEGPPGKEGKEGKEPKEGPFPQGNLPRGITIRGNYAAGGPAGVAGQFFWDQVSFGYQFASAPTPHFLPAKSSATAECPGSSTNPQATAGNLCVYEGIHIGTFTGSVFDPGTGANGSADRWGAGVVLTTGGGAENVSSYGTWAATSP
jgi:hypothetical protein